MTKQKTNTMETQNTENKNPYVALELEVMKGGKLKMEKKLEILVVEDTPAHQEAARRQLSDYNLTIVGNYDEAVDMLTGGSRYTPNRESIEKKAYDVVLTDMMYSQGRGDCQRKKSGAKKQRPFGYAVSMLALKLGVPYVGMISCGNHHDDSMVYTLDFLDNTDKETRKMKPLDLGKSKYLATTNELLRPESSDYYNPMSNCGKIGNYTEMAQEVRGDYKEYLDKMVDKEVAKQSKRFGGMELENWRKMEIRGELEQKSSAISEPQRVKNWRQALEILMGE